MAERIKGDDLALGADRLRERHLVGDRRLHGAVTLVSAADLYRPRLKVRCSRRSGAHASQGWPHDLPTDVGAVRDVSPSLTDCPRGRGGQGGAAGGAAQDDLADRQRPARQRRRLGLQDLRARHALLPLHLREPDRLPQRAGAQGRRRRTSTTRASATPTPSSAARRRSTRRASTSSPASCSPTSASARATTRTSTRRSQRVFTQHRGLRGRRRQRGRHQGPVRRPRRQQRQARPDRRQAQREARQAARRDRRPRPRRLRRQHDRRVRRRLRVPDDDVRLERRQVRRRVLHAAGGRPSCSPGSPSSARPR